MISACVGCLMSPPAVGAEMPARPSVTSRQAIPLVPARERHDAALQAWLQKDWGRLLKVALAWTAADSGNPSAWRYVGDAYFGKYAMPDAQAAYRKVLALEESPAVWESLGEAHLWQGIWHQSRSADELAAVEFEHALDCLEAALALDPAATSALGGIGATRYHRKEFDLARSALEAKLKYDPEDVRSWHYLGMAHAADGDAVAAVSAYREAVHRTKNPLAQLRNWLLLKKSAQALGRADLVAEADENLSALQNQIRGGS